MSNKQHISTIFVESDMTQLAATSPIPIVEHNSLCCRRWLSKQLYSTANIRLCIYWLKQITEFIHKMIYSISQEICTRFLLCCALLWLYIESDLPISIRLTSLALWQSYDCPSASKATLMNMDKYFMWIHYERLHNHNKAKHNKTVCIFLGIYCMYECLQAVNSWWLSKDNDDNDNYDDDDDDETDDEDGDEDDDDDDDDDDEWGWRWRWWWWSSSSSISLSSSSSSLSSSSSFFRLQCTKIFTLDSHVR